MNLLRQNKSLIALLLAAAVLLSTAGCGAGEEPHPEPEEIVPAGPVFKDLAGHEFTGPVTGACSVAPSFTMLILSMAPKQVLSVDREFEEQYLSKNGKSDLLFYLGLGRVRTLPVTASWREGVSPRELTVLEPDVIITSADDPKAEKLGDKTGCPVFIVSDRSLEDFAASIRALGQLFGKEELADRMAAFWEETTAAAAAAAFPEAERPRVYCSGSGGLLTVPGRDTLAASVVRTAGGVHLGDELSTEKNSADGAIEVSAAELKDWDPDVIITRHEAEYEELMTSADWAGLTAVKNGRVYCQKYYAELEGLTALPGLVWCRLVLGDTYDAAKEEYYSAALDFYELFYHLDPKEEDFEKLN